MMNIYELNELIRSLKSQPGNKDLIKFYNKKRKELVNKLNKDIKIILA